MSRRMKNNDGYIVRPYGRPMTNFSMVPDTIFADTSLSMSARLLLAFIAGRPVGWTMVVKNMCSELGMSEKMWRLRRNELRQAGIVPEDHPKRMGGGRNEFTWVLDIDLARYYLSTAHVPERADGIHPPFRHPAKRADKQHHLNQYQKHHHRQAAGGGGEGQEDQDTQTASHQQVIELARRAGLTPGEVDRVVQAAQGASQEQLAILAQLVGNPGAGVENLAAWTIGLAQRAARGILTPPRTPAAATASPVQVWQPEPSQPASPEVQAENLARLAQLRQGYTARGSKF